PLVPTCRYSLRGIATAFSSEDSGDHRARHSFPTRRSSDLHPEETVYEVAVGAQRSDTFPLLIVTDRRVLHVMDRLRGWTVLEEVDRKSTRLNSSHVKSSYAVFCLKKKRQGHPGSSRWWTKE